MTTKAQIENTLWNACDTFRGTIQSHVYKDYLLVMLFEKYLSDAYEEKYQELSSKYDGDAARIERALARERFILKEESKFSYLYENRNNPKIGELINKALENIEEENKGKLRNVFRSIDFNSSINFNDDKNKLAVLKTLLTDFNSLDLRPSQLDNADIIGDAYEYLIAKFASDAGQKGGEFYTPSMVSELVARIVDPKENDRILDPTCGSGSLLLKAFKKVPNGKAQIYGQELNVQTHALCKMNMFLHGVDDAKIFNGDTISNPQTLEGDKLMKFQVLACNPPFSLDKWAKGFAGDDIEDVAKFKMEANYDPYGRFELGVPPSSKGDYAFILHMLASLDEYNGRMAVVMPHGVLFRGSSEGKIRKQLIDLNLLDAVIGLPANLFYGTGIPACILVFKKNRSKNDVLFIDASGESNFEKGKNQNILREQDVQKIVDIYNTRSSVDKYSFVATKEQIAENEYNLNIPRYVDTFEEEPLIDIVAVNREIIDIKSQLQDIESQMAKYLKELGLDE